MSNSIVWVLGAGFSQSLGGPLTDDLLGPECRQKLRGYYPHEKYPVMVDGVLDAVIRVYHYGRRFDQGPVDGVAKEYLGERLWRNAEEFLEYVDVATLGTANSAGWRALNRILRLLHQPSVFSPTGKEARAFGAGARRLMAAECAAFLQGANIDTERWGPYRTWVQALRPQDVVITFNYDLVLERLHQRYHKLDVAKLGVQATVGLTRVLKLHGSVDWKRIEDGNGTVTIEQGQDDDFPCRCEPSHLAIASPGPSKEVVADDLLMLWDEAVAAIKGAGALVFLGYRFPPSDAEARAVLWTALGENTEPYLAVHSVLGPNLGAADPVRLRQLILYAMRIRHRSVQPDVDHHKKALVAQPDNHFNYEAQPLFAEDFLQVADRNLVLTPYLRPTLTSK